MLPQLTPDGRCVYSTDALECVLVSQLGCTREQARTWLLRVTPDTKKGTPGFVD